jgi:hypothetical protein
VGNGVAPGEFTTGAGAVRTYYKWTGYFQARYPVNNNGNWDLSNTTGLHFNVKHLPLPGSVYWQFNGPRVVLCGAQGGYRILIPAAQKLSTSFQFLDVPITGPSAGWSVQDVAPFSLSQVNSVEFHANPAGNGGSNGVNGVWGADLYVYYDDVRFY